MLGAHAESPGAIGPRGYRSHEATRDYFFLPPP